jgi:hypothetical protein
MYRTHKGDLQYWHGMSSGGDAAKATNDLLMRLVGPADAYLARPNDSRTGFEIGQRLHTIQDLYTPSHTERNANGEIVRFQDYGAQSSVYHAEKDVLDLEKKDDQILYRSMVDKTKKYLRSLDDYRSGRIDATAFKVAMETEYLRSTADGPDVGETAAEFAPRTDTVTGKIVEGTAEMATSAGRWMHQAAVDFWDWILE